MNRSASLKHALFATVFALTCASSAFATTYTFTTLDVPGASLTNANGINNASVIVGEFDNLSGSHGFVYNAGVFTTI